MENNPQNPDQTGRRQSPNGGGRAHPQTAHKASIEAKAKKAPDKSSQKEKAQAAFNNIKSLVCTKIGELAGIISTGTINQQISLKQNVQRAFALTVQEDLIFKESLKDKKADQQEKTNPKDQKKQKVPKTPEQQQQEQRFQAWKAKKEGLTAQHAVMLTAFNTAKALPKGTKDQKDIRDAAVNLAAANLHSLFLVEDSQNQPVLVEEEKVAEDAEIKP